MRSFYEHVRGKNPAGINFEDAVQLLLWVYSTLEILPPELRQLSLGRKELSTTFAQLANDKLIIGCPPNVAHSASQQSELYWNSIIDDFLSKRVALDPSFPPKIVNFI